MKLNLVLKIWLINTPAFFKGVIEILLVLVMRMTPPHCRQNKKTTTYFNEVTNNTDLDGIYAFWVEYRMLDKFENISSFFRAEVCQVTPGHQT